MGSGENNRKFYWADPAKRSNPGAGMQLYIKKTMTGFANQSYSIVNTWKRIPLIQFPGGCSRIRPFSVVAVVDLVVNNYRT